MFLFRVDRGSKRKTCKTCGSGMLLFTRIPYSAPIPFPLSFYLSFREISLFLLANCCWLLGTKGKKVRGWFTAIDSVLFQEGNGDLCSGEGLRFERSWMTVESFGERFKHLWSVVEWLWNAAQHFELAWKKALKPESFKMLWRYSKETFSDREYCGRIL